MTRRSTRMLNKRSPPANVPRQSKRLKADKSTPARSDSKSQAQNVKSTPKKSKYFGFQTASNSDKSGGRGELGNSKLDCESLNAGSEYDDENATVAPASASTAGETELSSEDDVQSRMQQQAATRKPPSEAKLPGGRQLLKEGVKTGLGPGKEVRIKLPRAREAGGIPYRDGIIHPNTFLFLKDLRDNNDREWLKLHDKDYRNSQKDFETFVEKLTEKVIEKDDTIPELPLKDLIMRIYRDMRFSSDPTPYRTHFGAGWSRTGRKGSYAGYFLALEPGKSFIVGGPKANPGGLYMPEASSLALIRREIDRKPSKLKRILRDAGLRREFLDNAPDNDREVVKEFVGGSSANALKTKPKVGRSCFWLV
ncbi:MAG: hypothetical protein M1840_004534 [Geoglossum simile]|nr:MAG: hypothetical protein M1840_004534 [Geoglossum simile]